MCPASLGLRSGLSQDSRGLKVHADKWRSDVLLAVGSQFLAPGQAAGLPSHSLLSGYFPSQTASSEGRTGSSQFTSGPSIVPRCVSA